MNLFTKVAAWLVIFLVLFTIFKQFDPRSNGATSAWPLIAIGSIFALAIAAEWLKLIIEKSTKRAVKEALEEWTKSK